MDKRLILAVAGSGKTTNLVNRLNKEDRVLIITYTNANTDNIFNQIINKFDKIPENYRIYNYFDFLYNFCFLPFAKNEEFGGFDFKSNTNRNLSKKSRAYYKNFNGNRMYSNRLGEYCLNKYILKIKDRIEKYFDNIYIDEAQDLASRDFQLIYNLVEKVDCNFYLYGDFYQHTFDTSRDGNYQKKLYDDYKNFLKEIKKISPSLIIDTNLLSKSMRCPLGVSNFIKNNIKIDIDSFDEENLKEPILVTNDLDIEGIIKNNNIVKLFLKDSSKYEIENTNNWGNCKGLTYNDVCVILNKKTYDFYIKNELEKMESLTKNRFYVACSRCKNNLYFIEENKLKKYKKTKI